MIDKYVLFFRPQKETFESHSCSRVIESWIYGEELQRKFGERRNAIADTYGPPTRNFDFLKSWQYLEQKSGLDGSSDTTIVIVPSASAADLA
jgi:hypothetical protein